MARRHNRLLSSSRIGRMEWKMLSDGGTTVDPADRESLRRNLEQFAGAERVHEDADGTLVAEFSGSTCFSVSPAGRVSSGMPLHGFEGPADTLRFDHDSGRIRVTVDAASYTFRRP